MENEKNIFAIPALVFLFLALSSLSFSWLQGWELNKAFNITGILSTMIGTCWVAGGILLSNNDKQHLKKIKSTYKYKNKVSELMIYASRTIPLGMIYIVLGGIFQIIATLYS